MKEKIKRLIVIEGPTASGKTALSIAIAKHFNTVILSADSRQFYREIAIGTAKPSLEEQAGIKHYFIDSHSIEEDFTAAKFAYEAELVLKEAFKSNETIVLVGGSGMFIDALCNGLDEIPTDPILRKELMAYVELNGIDSLINELKEKDPVFYAQVDLNNPVRIMRAIEVMRISGQAFSSLRKATKKVHDFEIQRFVIDHPREQLYSRINLRVDSMLENGLLEEVKSVVVKKHLNALKTVGYSELFEYLDGEITFEDAIEKIKQNSRRYAKRQLTWFRKHEDATWIPFESVDAMKNNILSKIT